MTTNELPTQVLRQIIDGYGPSPIGNVDIGSPPDDYHLDGLWVTFSIRSDDEFRYIYGKWQSLVAVGLADEIAAASGQSLIKGVTFIRERPGRVFDESRVVERPFRVSTAPISKSELDSRIAAAATAAAFDIVRVEYLQVLKRIAVVISIRAGKTAGLHGDDQQLISFLRRIGGGSESPEGVYVRVLAADNQVIQTLGYAVRTASTVRGKRIHPFP